MFILFTMSKHYLLMMNKATLNRTTPQSVFFKPYKSPLEVLGRTTSIVTDSLFLGSVSAYCALEAGWNLLKTLKNLCSFNTTAAKKNFHDSVQGTLVSLAMLVIAVLSPLINLIDLVAGGVNSLKQACQNEEPTRSMLA